MNNQVSPETALEVVVGCEVLVRWRHLGVVKDFADLPVAPRTRTAPLRLHADDRVSVLHPCYNNFPLVNHRRGNAVLLLARRVSPRLAQPFPHLRAETSKPLFVVRLLNECECPALAYDFVNGRPPEFGNSLSTHNFFYECLAVFGWLRRLN